MTHSLMQCPDGTCERCQRDRFEARATIAILGGLVGGLLFALWWFS